MLLEKWSKNKRATSLSGQLGLAICAMPWSRIHGFMM